MEPEIVFSQLVHSYPDKDLRRLKNCRINLEYKKLDTCPLYLYGEPQEGRISTVTITVTSGTFHLF